MHLDFMFLDAHKHVGHLVSNFRRAYYYDHENVDGVIASIMELSLYLQSLRHGGLIGAYLSAMDDIDSFLRETPMELIMEDERDPLILEAIARELPIHHVSDLRFFLSSSDEAMNHAVLSIQRHISITSAHTLRNDVVSIASALAEHGHVKSLDTLLGFFEQVAKNHPMILNKARISATLCGVFEGFWRGGRWETPSEKLNQMVKDYLDIPLLDFDMVVPGVESGIGLGMCGYKELGNRLAKLTYPKRSEKDAEKVIDMAKAGIEVREIVDSMVDDHKNGWLEPVVNYLLTVEGPDVKMPELNLALPDIKTTVKHCLLALPKGERFNTANVQALINEYGRLYPDEGQNFCTDKDLRPLALKVERYREAEFGADLGL